MNTKSSEARISELVTELASYKTAFIGSNAKQPEGELSTHVFETLLNLIRESFLPGVGDSRTDLVKALNELGYAPSEHLGQPADFFNSSYKHRAFVAGRMLEGLTTFPYLMPVGLEQIIVVNKLHIYSEQY